MKHFKLLAVRACVLLAATAALPASADGLAQPGQSLLIPTADSSSPVAANQGVRRSDQTLSAEGPSPYRLKLQYTGEAWDNAEGGLHTGTPYMQNIDAQLMVDADSAFGWKGGRIFVEGFYNTARSLDTQYVGAVQDPSIIDTSGVKLFRLYEAYYDQKLGDTDILVGVYDPQTEFANTKPMEIFFNGGYAWTTTLDQSGAGGLNGPSTYPDTSAGFRVRQKIDAEWSVQATVLDGMSDSAKRLQDNTFEFKSKFGAFAIGEVDYTPLPRTKIMAGFWGYTGKFDTQDQTNGNGSIRQTYGSDGGYIGGATRLCTIEGRRGLDAFVNVGFADATVNQITRTVNAGVTLTGLLDSRPRDRFGFAVSVAGDGEPYRRAQIAQGNGVYDNETNFEVTYRATIFSWLTVQPDVQYWLHTSLDPTLKNDLLFGLHFEIGHVFDL